MQKSLVNIICIIFCIVIIDTSYCQQFETENLPIHSNYNDEYFNGHDPIVIVLRKNIIDWSDENDKDFQPVNVRRSKFSNIEAKSDVKEKELSRLQHEKKVQELNKFMDEYWMSTNYFYDEMKRILRTRTVKDSLRKMLDYLEKPGKDAMKAQILKCYDTARKEEVTPVDIWRHKTNNMVINVIRDPFNDGYMN